MRNLLLASLLAFLYCTPVSAQQGIYTTDLDREVFRDKVGELTPYKDLPDDELLVRTARSFLGTPYVAGTLERVPEELVINIHQTDCILFVEMCIGLVEVLRTDTPSFDGYCSIIRNMRYRGGVTAGYDSRIHYTSEWIQQNEKSGILEEISSVYGKSLSQKFSFMSSHPDSYPQLRDSHDMTMRIRRVEDELNKKGTYYYIPKDMLEKSLDCIKDGDIICFVTTVEGLDISHVAIAYHTDGGELHFIHASSREKKVVIEKKTLSDYTKYGIRLLRLR